MLRNSTFFFLNMGLGEIDESMQVWLGPGWREDSLTSQHEWLSRMSNERKIDVWVMISWTKIWSCPGIRLGSVVGPTPEALHRIKQNQVPWSVNTMALAFTSEVVKDHAFLQRTWELTPQWRAHVCFLSDIFCGLFFFSIHSFISTFPHLYFLVFWNSKYES